MTLTEYIRSIRLNPRYDNQPIESIASDLKAFEIHARNLEQERDEAFNAGLEAAAQKCEKQADGMAQFYANTIRALEETT